MGVFPERFFNIALEIQEKPKARCSFPINNSVNRGVLLKPGGQFVAVFLHTSNRGWVFVADKQEFHNLLKYLYGVTVHRVLIQLL